MKTAKLFRNGRSQGVRLPREFRFEGDHVFQKRVGNGVLILPSKKGWDTLIHSLGQFSEDFMAERDRPAQRNRSELFRSGLCSTPTPASNLQRPKLHTPGDTGISSITLAELSFGADKGRQKERNKAALDDFAAPLEIARFDAAALAPALVTLVTHNRREFSRITGLRLAAWVES